MFGRLFFTCGALLLAGRAVHAGELPTDEHYRSATEIKDAIHTGEFSPLLDLHVMQHRADPDWSADWARVRYERSGIRVETGSISGRDLYGMMDIELNAPLDHPLGLRYERRSYDDRRFDFTFERLEGHGYVADGVALVLAGWPATRKEDSSLGAGIHLGSPAISGHLRFLYWDDRWIHESKRRRGISYGARPIRYMADGYYEYGKWRYYGTVNVGRTYVFTDVDAFAGTGIRGAGYGHYADGGAQWRHAAMQAGMEFRAAAAGSEREAVAEDASLEGYRFHRTWLQTHGYAKLTREKWSTKILVGTVRQWDGFGFDSYADGRYRMRAWLSGVETGWLGWDKAEIRLGYLANWFVMERRLDASGQALLAARQGSGYTDKIHLKWLYEFMPLMKVELLLSHEVTDGTFGGAAAKAMLLF